MNAADKENRRFDLSIVSQYRTEIYGAAILWIMIFHGYLLNVSYETNVPVLRQIGQFLMTGNMGVEIFLFLSGISLYFSMKRDSNLAHFMKKRLLRLYLPVICIGWVSWIWIFAREHHAVGELLASFTALRFWIDGNQQVWFVSLILVLYFFYPFIYSILFEAGEDKKIWVRTGVLLVTVMALTLILRAHAGTYYGLIEIALTRFPVFIIGCSFGKMIYEKKNVSKLWWILIWISLIYTFFLLAADVLHGPYRRWLYLFGGIPLTFVFAAVFSKIPKSFLKPFRFMGKMSLELYVMHLALKRLYEKRLLPFPFVSGSRKMWLVLILASIVLSWLVYLLEQTILSRKLPERSITTNKPEWNRGKIKAAAAGAAVFVILIAGVSAYRSSNAYYYRRGLSYLRSGAYAQAESSFKRVGEYKDAQEQILKCQYMKLSSAALGKNVRYGDFEWKVLDRDELAGIITMIAVEINESHPFYAVSFHEEEVPVTWETSSLREWLNGEVLEKHFSEQEKNYMILQNSQKTENEGYGTGYDSATQDYLTLLSVEEARKYKTKLDELGNDAWLRTPGNSMSTASYITAQHKIRMYGLPVTTALTVRPVIQIKYKELIEEEFE